MPVISLKKNFLLPCYSTSLHYKRLWTNTHVFIEGTHDPVTEKKCESLDPLLTHKPAKELG